jgi:hypothetical protein
MSPRRTCVAHAPYTRRTGACVSPPIPPAVCDAPPPPSGGAAAPWEASGTPAGRHCRTYPHKGCGGLPRATSGTVLPRQGRHPHRQQKRNTPFRGVGLRMPGWLTCAKTPGGGASSRCEWRPAHGSASRARRDARAPRRGVQSLRPRETSHRAGCHSHKVRPCLILGAEISPNNQQEQGAR